MVPWGDCVCDGEFIISHGLDNVLTVSDCFVSILNSDVCCIVYIILFYGM